MIMMRGVLLAPESPPRTAARFTTYALRHGAFDFDAQAAMMISLRLEEYIIIGHHAV